MSDADRLAERLAEIRTRHPGSQPEIASTSPRFIAPAISATAIGTSVTSASRSCTVPSIFDR